MNDVLFMKIYSKYDNMHHKCMNYALKFTNNHVIASIYCILLSHMCYIPCQKISHKKFQHLNYLSSSS